MSSIITIQIHHIDGPRGLTFIAAASPERACEHLCSFEPVLLS